MVDERVGAGGRKLGHEPEEAGVGPGAEGDDLLFDGGKGGKEEGDELIDGAGADIRSCFGRVWVVFIIYLTFFFFFLSGLSGPRGGGGEGCFLSFSFILSSWCKKTK